MAISARVLLENKYLENVQTTQYIATGVVAVIDKITVTNVTTLAASLSINIVAFGGAAGASNRNISNKLVQAGETYVCELAGHILAAGDFISTIADTSSALVCRISGREVS